MFNVSKANGTFTTTLIASVGLATLTLLGGCSSGSSGGGGGTVNLQSLAGNVRGAGTGGLEGVTITVGTASTVSDANGDFILPSVGTISTGNVTVSFDGSTATAPGTFPELDVIVQLGAGVTTLTMPNVITLPDLASANSAVQTVALMADGSSTAPIAVTGALPDLSLSAATGTIVTIAGMVGDPMVDINITPVDPSEVPMPLDDGLLAGNFVTIQPSNAGFDQPGAPTGLDVVFPNDLDLPIGTMVDIWSFDHDVGAWVNRSTETGEVGTVVDLGGGMTEIQASGVITEGGWHAPALTVDAACATIFTGTVLDQATMLPIAGASIGLSTGQFGTSGIDGTFSITSVPAYDIAAHAADSSNCTAVDISYEIVLPPAFGSLSSGSTTFMAANVVTGGTSALGNAPFTIPTTGSLAGIVNGDGASMGEQVLITPLATGTTYMVTPNSNGSFFLNGVEAGDYTASYLFDGQINPTEFPVTVAANTISTFTLQFAVGMGPDIITVTVFEDDDNELTTMTPLAGAQVVLQGSDAGSMLGLIMTTDANGEAVFEDVDGPYTITAVKDFLDNNETGRIATSLIDVAPTDDTIGILLCFEQEPDISVLDATLDGVVTNMPTLSGTETLEVHASAAGFGGDDVFNGTAAVDPQTGAYSMAVPSDTALITSLVLIDSAASTPVVSTLLQPGIAPISSGDSGPANFDFTSTELVAWDQTVSATFNGVDVGITDIFVEACMVDRSTGNLFFQDLYFGPPSAMNVNLPDLTDPALADYDFVIFGEGEYFGISQTCNKWLVTTPTSLSFNFLGVGSAIVPDEGDSFTEEEFQALMTSFNEAPEGGLGANGVNVYFYETFDNSPVSGIDFGCWTVFMPAGVEIFDMPLLPLPLFAEGEALEAGFEQVRFSSSFNFNTFFNQNLDQNLDGLFANQSSEYASEVFFTFDLQAAP